MVDDTPEMTGLADVLSDAHGDADSQTYGRRPNSVNPLREAMRVVDHEPPRRRVGRPRKALRSGR
jgi:hypothetical protein